MATALTHAHIQQTLTGRQREAASEKKIATHGVAAAFVSDLIEDVQQKPLQPAALAKHDMFREHIQAMSISYFALIILLILASLPILAYVVRY